VALRTALLCLTLTISSISTSFAVNPPKAGATCPRLGLTQNYNGKKFTCIKSGKKLVWSKGTVTATTPSNPRSSTSTSSPSSTASRCTTPLARDGANICWQVAKIGDDWNWVTHSPSSHTPYALPDTVAWRKIDAPKLGGAENQLTYSNSKINALAAELNYYWIEVDIEGGKTITAAVWSPKTGSNYPVLVHFHGTAGLMYLDVEFAAQLAKKGYVLVVPTWWGPRPTSIESFFPKSKQTLFENPNGPKFIGANLETPRMLLPLLKAATLQTGANATNLGVLGHSRGGTLALHVAVTTPFVKVAIPLVAPYLPPQMNSVVQNPQEPGWETLPKSVVNQLNQKALVVGAKNDQTVPTASTQDYMDAARNAGKSNIEPIWLDVSHQLIFDYNPAEQRLTIDTITRFLSENLK